MLVEGSLTPGQDDGLRTALQLGEGLAPHLDRPLEVSVAARISPEQQAHWLAASRVPLVFHGAVARERIPELDRSAQLFFSAEINSACPNAVIEALACGLPVIGFDTGALQEVVGLQGGKVIPYGADPWRLERPHVPPLVEAAVQVLSALPAYQAGARRRAEEAFGLEHMLDEYLDVLLG